MAVMLGMSNVSTTSPKMILIQLAVTTVKHNQNSLQKAAKAAILTTVAINDVIAVGEPS